PGIAAVWSKALPEQGLAELAAKVAAFDWTDVEDPAGRALQEARAAEDRKKNGAFYTSRRIVEQLLDAVERGRTLLGARVLDPACGSGTFLVAAARRGAMVAGADVDPEAVEVAQFRVRCGARIRDGQFVTGNLLGDRGSLEGPFDAVVGNPPYVRFHHLAEKERTQLSFDFETATGQFDLFAPFLETSLSRVREGGRVAFVLPSLVLRGARYRDLRRYVLDHAHVREVVDLGDGAFEGVLAPTCILVVERRHARTSAKSGRAVVRWSRPAARAGRAETLSVDESRWRSDAALAFAPVAEDAGRILEKLAALPRLAEVAHLGRGVEIGRRHPALHEETGPGRVVCVTGSDVERHRVLGWRWLELAGLEARERPSADEMRARVVVRETGERLTAVRVPANTATTRSLFDVVPKDARRFPPEFLAGWLNSALAQWWFATCVRAESGIFPKVRIGQLGTLGVPDDPRLIAALLPIVRRREAALSSQAILRLEAEIDGAIHEALGLDAAEVRLVLSALAPVRK
ncbi:MAG TPA: N-6 DNA methylase, partial [bacterium]|nr:N-6 DNA methylase [bacterium]